MNGDSTGRIPVMMPNTTNATIKIPKGREVEKVITATIREKLINKTNSSDDNINSLVNVEEQVEAKEYKKKW